MVSIGNAFQSGERGEEIRRDLHTLEGVCRLFGFLAVANQVNRIEDDLDPGPCPESEWLAAVSRRREHRNDLSQVLGLCNDYNFVTVREEKLVQLSWLVAATGDA